MMKKIEGYSGYYITPEGDVYSTKKYDHPKKMNKTLTNQGYFRLCLIHDSGKMKSELVHRLVAKAYIDNPQNKPHVNHINGVKTDNCVENLEWVTASENQKHAYAINLKFSGLENNSRAILSKDKVIEIYKRLLDGERRLDLAKEFNVSSSAIDSIKRKKNWLEYLKDFEDIKFKPKNKALGESTVRWVCKCLSSGMYPSEILSISKNKNLTIDQIYDIKRRKCHIRISSEYNW